METYSFRIVLAEPDRILDDPADDGFMKLCDAVFEAGCDDSTPGACNGIVHIDFDREAESLGEAIQSAIADVERAGYRVARVEPDRLDVFDEINASLTGARSSTARR